MITGSYESIRDDISDGDIVFIKGSWKNPISALIMFITRSQYTHCGIAFWIYTAGEWNGRLMLVEAQNGTSRRIVNFSFYQDRQMTIVTPPLEWEYVEDRALGKIAKTKYNLFEAMYTGIREFLCKLNIRLPKKDFSGEICSEFVAKVFDLKYTSVSPQRLFKELLREDSLIKFEITYPA